MPFETYPPAVRPVVPAAPPLSGNLARAPGNSSGMRRHTDFFHFPP